MALFVRQVLAAAAFFCALTSPARAADPSPLSVDVKLGVQYDSVVSVDQTDLTAQRGDQSTIFGLSGRYTPLHKGGTQITLGYDFDQTNYAELTDYNLQVHSPSISAQARRGRLNLGAEYRFYHMQLGGDAFLDLQTASPSLSTLVGRRFFLRGAYVYSRKNFRTSDALDATGHAGEISATYLFRKPGGTLTLSGRYDHENTRNAAYDYHGWTVAGRLQVPFNDLAKGTRLRAGLAYRSRAYENETPSIGVPRREHRYSYALSADIPVARGLLMRPEWRKNDRNSNYPAANYVEDVLSLSVILRR